MKNITKNVFVILMTFISIIVVTLWSIFTKESMSTVLCLILLACLTSGIIYLNLADDKIESGDTSDFVDQAKLILVIYLLCLIISLLTTFLSPYVRPLAACGIIFAIMTSRNIGIVVNIFLSALVVLLSGDTPDVLIYYILFGTIACELSGFFMKSEYLLGQSVTMLALGSATAVLIRFLKYRKFDVAMVINVVIGIAVILVIVIEFVQLYKKGTVPKKVVPKKIPLVPAEEVKKPDEYRQVMDENFELLQGIKKMKPAVYAYAKLVTKLSSRAGRELKCNDEYIRAFALYQNIVMLYGRDNLNEGIKDYMECGLPDDLIAEIIKSTEDNYIPIRKESLIVTLAQHVMGNIKIAKKKKGDAADTEKIIRLTIFNKAKTNFYDDAGITVKEMNQIRESFTQSLSDKK